MRLLATLLLVLAPLARAAGDLPLITGKEPDPWGFKVETADKVTLRKLLLARKYEQLTATLEALQTYSEEDCARELVSLDAFETFASADSRLEKAIDAWATSTPEAWAPRLARGVWLTRQAFERRGAAPAAQTPEAKFTAMRRAIELARTELEASLARHPTLAARRAFLDLAMLSEDAELSRQHLRAALESCPASLAIRVKLMATLRPRWGGSYELMQAVAADAPVEANPKLRVLWGLVESDQCSPGERDALSHCDAALAFGAYWEFLTNKGEVLLRLGRPREALAAFDQALAQRPQKAALHALRAAALEFLGREREAEAARRAGSAIDPAETLLQ